MATIEQIKEMFTVGAVFESYYGNGERQTQLHNDGTRTPAFDKVTKISEKSCWMGCSRVSWNTLKSEYDGGIYRTIN